jgi:hypothetical protein
MHVCVCNDCECMTKILNVASFNLLSWRSTKTLQIWYFIDDILSLFKRLSSCIQIWYIIAVLNCSLHHIFKNHILDYPIKETNKGTWSAVTTSGTECALSFTCSIQCTATLLYWNAFNCDVPRRAWLLCKSGIDNSCRCGCPTCSVTQSTSASSRHGLPLGSLLSRFPFISTHYRRLDTQILYLALQFSVTGLTLSTAGLFRRTLQRVFRLVMTSPRSPTPKCQSISTVFQPHFTCKT